jgi:phosphate transport system substrate-binding protein
MYRFVQCGYGAALLVLAIGSQVFGQGAKVDDSIPPYKQVSGISGDLTSIGSDTLGTVMDLWAKAYASRYPSVNPQIQSPGSANAPTALIAGTAQLGPMSRAMKAEEEDKFEQKFGYKPTRISVALDCVAVYVNKDNPIHGLTLDQLDCVFSKTRKSGFADVSTWGQLGLTGDWERLPISLYGRNSESGTYAYFKEHVFKKGDYKDTVKEQPGSAAVVNGVAKDRAGIGYSGIGYKTSEVRTVKLTAKLTAPLAEPSYENALNGKYPLSRTLYIYVNKKPNEPLPPVVAEFLKLALSKEGQEIVVKEGYLPLTGQMAAKQLATLK